ncbi:MAG: hypothetical protein JST02_01125 [Bacteroidetes bacterium]|nr:hypothetical protein [Bacteroidota bacterium]
MKTNYTNEEIKLAREIATTLDDHDSIAMHLKFARIYKEARLRAALAKVMAVPEDQIRNSRAALYVSIIKGGDRYGHTGY